MKRLMIDNGKIRLQFKQILLDKREVVNQRLLREKRLENELLSRVDVNVN